MNSVIAYESAKNSEVEEPDLWPVGKQLKSFLQLPKCEHI